MLVYQRVILIGEHLNFPWNRLIPWNESPLCSLTHQSLTILNQFLLGNSPFCPSFAFFSHGFTNIFPSFPRCFLGFPMFFPCFSPRFPTFPLREDDEAWTPLHSSASRGAAALVATLLAAKVDVEAATSSGATAMHFAASKGGGWIGGTMSLGCIYYIIDTFFFSLRHVGTVQSRPMHINSAKRPAHIYI